MTNFKSAQYPKDVILYAVFFYVRYGVSYRDLEEIMEVGAPSYLMKHLGLLSPIRFIHAPRSICISFLRVSFFSNGWRITDNPTIERSMININPSFYRYMPS
jgi:hypothetical protein